MSQSYYHQEWRFGAAEKITWAVQRLILANAIVFALQLILDVPFGMHWGEGGIPGGWLAHWLAFQPLSVLRGALWQPFTYMFLHGSLMHLFMNLLWLYFFGPDVERVLGTGQFFRFYGFCGVVGVLATYVRFALGVFAPTVFMDNNVPVVGASGAVMGVLVAYAVINPERQFFLFPLPIPINARALVIIVIVMNLFALQGGNTSVATHFGGMAAGFAYMKLAPMVRNWPGIHAWWRRRTGRGQKIGDEVDNIFRFEDKKKWR